MVVSIYVPVDFKLAWINLDSLCDSEILGKCGMIGVSGLYFVILELSG